MAKQEDALNELETAIASGLDEFLATANLLKQVRERSPETWPAYCHRQFSESSELIDEMIEFAQTMQEAK